MYAAERDVIRALVSLAQLDTGRWVAVPSRKVASRRHHGPSTSTICFPFGIAERQCASATGRLLPPFLCESVASPRGHACYVIRKQQPAGARRQAAEFPFRRARQVRCVDRTMPVRNWKQVSRLRIVMRTPVCAEMGRAWGSCLACGR
jgi:hypothetical protein